MEQLDCGVDMNESSEVEELERKLEEAKKRELEQKIKKGLLIKCVDCSAYIGNFNKRCFSCRLRHNAKLKWKSIGNVLDNFYLKFNSNDDVKSIFFELEGIKYCISAEGGGDFLPCLHLTREVDDDD